MFGSDTPVQPRRQSSIFNFQFLIPLTALFVLSAFAQPVELSPVTARSTSGQFVVRGLPQGLPRTRSSSSEVSYLRLDPSLTAVSLERIRQILNGELNLSDKWRGLISVATFPVQEDNAAVRVTSVHYANGWGYNVEFPEIVDKPRFLRSAVSVLLMEFVNRTAVTREAELPPWLAEGLTAHLEATALPTLALEPGGEIAHSAARVDPLRSAREIIRARGPLTFTQLSLPGDAELSGSGHELFRACSHLLVHELLHLRGGREALREMLASLPRHLNWQTAFLRAYRDHFPALIDADKWYMLAATHMAGRDSNSVWPLDTTFAQLDAILSTAVQVRASADDLPITTQVKLQRVISEWEPVKQAPVLGQKLIQLETLRRRAAAELVELVTAYELVLDGYVPRRSARSRQAAVARLDALDERLAALRTRLSGSPAATPAPVTTSAVRAP
jgi:hypothetical protein